MLPMKYLVNFKSNILDNTQSNIRRVYFNRSLISVDILKNWFSTYYFFTFIHRIQYIMHRTSVKSSRYLDS